MLVGIGFDIHRHSQEDVLYLGGLKLDGPGFQAHSDGDILLHTLCDALLGALSKKDLGHYFPSNNKTPKKISSVEMLEEVLNIIEYKKYIINNIDVILISQTINIENIRTRLVENLGVLLNIDVSKINIKGKTTDNIGMIGSKEASACQTIISISDA
tara:strand:- start:1881 stop:2351 length:471 start_codon:yes stop_codon:yes gene_type:complete